MGKARKSRQFAVAKKLISPKDSRVRKNSEKNKEKNKKDSIPARVEQQSSALFFEYNEHLGPPYNILVDTNFLNFSIR